MKINTRLMLAVFVPITLVLVVCLALGLSYRTTQIAQRNGDNVRQIRSSVLDMTGFLYSYILHNDERPKQQFAAAYASMSSLIGQVRPQNAQQRQLLDDVRVSGEAMNRTFSMLTSAYEAAKVGGDSELISEAEAALTGQLLISAHDADEDAALLRSVVDADIGRSQVQAIAIVLGAALAAMLPLTYLLVQTRRRIVGSLATLQQGTEVVGAGNLDYTLPVKGKDEVSDLARAFNQMSASLKSVTASKADLEKEIIARQSAEEELRITNEILQEQTVELQAEIEEHRRAEVALEKRTFELETANKELEAFSYSVSHDLRQPLRALEGFSDLLMEDYRGKLDEAGLDYLRRIRKAAQYMSELIDDMLKLSRVTRAELFAEQIDLSRMARSIADDLQAAEPDRSVDVKIAVEMAAQGDRSLVSIALRNLLENAWKFTAKCSYARIDVGQFSQNGTKVYFIRDNGIGFNTQYKDKLFQPFQRLHSDKDYPGTGIGLAIVQRIIRRHAGQVWADSEEGKGTTFYFTLS